MRRSLVVLLAAGALLAAGSLASAQSTGPDKLTQELETTFGVTADQVSALQADGLGFGEIYTLLALAQTMPGGDTAANIAAVLAMRQGPPVQGWGQVAKSMGVNLGQVISAGRSNGASGAGAGNGAGHANGHAK